MLLLPMLDFLLFAEAVQRAKMKETTEEKGEDKKTILQTCLQGNTAVSAKTEKKKKKQKVRPLMAFQQKTQLIAGEGQGGGQAEMVGESRWKGSSRRIR